MRKIISRQKKKSWATCSHLASLRTDNYPLTTVSIQRHFRIHRPRPPINPAPHRLYFFEPLLPQPGRHAQGTHAMMTNHNNVVLRVEFLVGAHGYVTHRNIPTSL